MERKVNYTVVGGFVLAFILAINVFVIWISTATIGSNVPYNIYFAGSVTGLQEGSSVRYRGVPVGTVKEIKINPENVEQVRVTIHVDTDTPVKEDAYASIESMGLTGITYIQINGGSQSAKPLQYDGRHNPIIPSRASRLEEVVSSVPDVLRQASTLIQDVRAVFSEDTRKSFQNILQNIELLTGAFVDKDNKSGAGHTIQDAAHQLKMSLKSLQSVADEIDALLEDNHTNVSRFLSKAYETFDTFDRIGRSLENSPSRFLTNDPQQGVRLP